MFNYAFICKILDQLNQNILFYLQMRGLAREHLIDIVSKFEPCPENLQRMVLGIDGMRNLLLPTDFIILLALIRTHLSLKVWLLA